MAAIPEVGLQVGTLLLSFTLALLVVFVFVVRLLLIATGRPVPLDPFDMAKPRDFRTIIVAAAALVAPIAAGPFLPARDLDQGPSLILIYAFQVLLAIVLWLLLEALYRLRARRRAGR
jgi:4-amino-4-deoxy-L-arabinose transferase-like glycosyltransferase